MSTHRPGRVSFISQLLAAASLACAAGAAGAVDFNTNLVVNGDAESGLAGWTAYAEAPLFSAAAYGPNWVLPTQPGPTDRGTSLFVGGSVAYAAAYQQFDVSDNAQAIGTGLVGYALSGWLGGWLDQSDNTMVYVSFLDTLGNLLGSAALGPTTPDGREGQTGLFYMETAGYLPAQTSVIEFALSMERLNGGDNDGYADNLAFTLAAPVPEPGSLVLMLLGGAVLAGAVARRR